MHLVQIAEGQIDGNRVRWQCPDCQAEIQLPLKSSTTTPTKNAEPPLVIGDTTQTTEPSDLLTRRLDAVAQEVRNPGMVNAFRALHSNSWNDPEAHGRFLQKANQHQALAVAGKLYGTILQISPNDPVAQKAREKILQLGMAQLGAMRTATPRRARGFNRKLWLIGGGIIVVLVAFSLILATSQALMGPAGDSFK